MWLLFITHLICTGLKLEWSSIFLSSYFVAASSAILLWVKVIKDQEEVKESRMFNPSQLAQQVAQVESYLKFPVIGSSA